ncbi:hypothetical protein, partial [Streptomyces evansiae]
AVEFSRNGRFLRTHPLGLSSGRFPFGISCFRLYQILADPISSVLSGSRPGLSAFPFPFRRFRLYQIFGGRFTGCPSFRIVRRSAHPVPL